MAGEGGEDMRERIRSERRKGKTRKRRPGQETGEREGLESGRAGRGGQSQLEAGD